MEKSLYIINFKPEFAELRATAVSANDFTELEEPKPVVVSILQGGFAQDVIDDELQVKERYLEYLFTSTGIDLPRTDEAFDTYFSLQSVEEFIDLDEEA